MKSKKSVEKMPALKQESNAEDKLLEISQNLLSLTAQPGQYLVEQPEKYNETQKMMQKMYAITITSDKDNEGNQDILPEVVVDEMDEEQIWQQLELRNSLIINGLIEKTSSLMALREQKFEIHLDEFEGGVNVANNDKIDNGDMFAYHQDEDYSCGDTAEDEQSSEDDDRPLQEDEDLFKPSHKRKRDRKRKSVVDDKFFKLDEMEEFLESVEEKEARKAKGKISDKDDDGIDYFSQLAGEDDDDSDECNSNPNYRDFFDTDDDDNMEDTENTKGDGKKRDIKQKDIFADSGEEADSDGDKEMVADEYNTHQETEETKEEYNDKNGEGNGHANSDSYNDSDDNSESGDKMEEVPKSSFEMKQSRLEQRIRDYEDEVLGERPWQLKGEVQAENRPQNSLLEEVLEFESTVRPAPIITEETTRRLEDIIKQRIKDKAWDDVERTIKPTHTPQDYRKQLVLDQEKSKESLAHIYEKEYQRELEKLDPNRDSNEPEESKEHKEIRNLMRNLFVKLDALSNFHFTPKPVAPEAKIVTNTPAVTMEEVAPVAVSDAKLLAPEEVFRGPKRELIGKSERNKTDKNRSLRHKKSKQRAIHNALEAKDLQKQKMGIPLSKKEESAKLMKKLTKQRNVDKITSSDDKGALKSSKAFFSKLQDQLTPGSTAKANKKKTESKTLSAKKHKL